jgi:dTDP-4-amino-4,6-dideoxygalactose transaminase
MQRPELREFGFKDPREAVDAFESKVAAFAGSKYAVAVDSCSHGIFLSLKYSEIMGNLWHTITIPKNTYISVPMQIVHAGFGVSFIDYEWSGVYQLRGSYIFDGAVRWTRGMYKGGLHVVSFQYKKRVPIGKGGMILTDSKDAYDILRLMRYDGRDMSLPYDHPNHIRTMGYHMYMTPEDAARGILLMDKVPDVNEDSGSWESYPDISKIFNNL